MPKDLLKEARAVAQTLSPAASHHDVLAACRAEHGVDVFFRGRAGLASIALLVMASGFRLSAAVPVTILKLTPPKPVKSKG